MIQQTIMTQTDAFLFAIKRALEQERSFIDTKNVRSMQIGITIDKAGEAHITIHRKSEYVVTDCIQGASRIDKFIFHST